MEILYQILAGFAGGILGGMGMGGGTLLIPILVIFLLVKQKMAQGINLISFLPMSIISIIIHLKNKMIEYKFIWIVIVSGALFSLLGSFLIRYFKNNNLKLYFGIFLVLIAVYEIIIFILDIKNKNKNNNKNIKK